MSVRSRYQTVALLAVVALAALLGKRLLFPAVSIRAATTDVPPAQSYLVILGVGDTTPTNWDGSLTVTGGGIQIVRGWRFAGTDSISSSTSSAASWKMNTARRKH